MERRLNVIIHYSILAISIIFGFLGGGMFAVIFTNLIDNILLQFVFSCVAGFYVFVIMYASLNTINMIMQDKRRNKTL